MSNNYGDSGAILPISSSERIAIKGGNHHQDISLPELSASGIGDLVDIQIGEGFVSVSSSSSSMDLDTQNSDSSSSSSTFDCNF